MAKRHEKTNHAYNSCAINISGNITGFSYAYYKQTKIQTNFIKKKTLIKSRIMQIFD